MIDILGGSSKIESIKENKSYLYWLQLIDVLHVQKKRNTKMSVVKLTYFVSLLEC